MVVIDLINQLMNPRKRRVLALAEINMEPHKFQVFRKQFLKEFGNSELVRDMEREFLKIGKSRNGATPAERDGQKYIAGKEVP